jgi:hypothetical protein
MASRTSDYPAGVTVLPIDIAAESTFYTAITVSVLV